MGVVIVALILLGGMTMVVGTILLAEKLSDSTTRKALKILDEQFDREAIHRNKL